MWKKNWHKNKYINFVKDIINPKFLIDLIIPHDIFSFIKSLNIKKSEEQVYRFIIGCSVFNAVLIGMPGDVGMIGVWLARAVEIAMAFQIAKMVGLIELNVIFSLSKLIKLISAIGITSFTVVYAFKAILDIVFKFINNLSFGAALPVTATSQIITTLFYGMFIYLAFTEIKKFENIKSLSMASLGKISVNASKYTAGIAKSLIKLLMKDFPLLTKSIAQNIKDAFDVNNSFKKQLKGEFFFAGSLAYLLNGEFEKLEGPFAKKYIDAWREHYLEAWRLANPQKLGPEATLEDIRNHALSYDAEELEEIITKNINPKFFEILEVTKENADGDEWSAELIEEQNNPASDAIFRNAKTGETVEVNYKFSTNKHYIESHIQEHPDVPVIVPKDIEDKVNSPFASHYEKDAVIEISEDNFEQMLNQYSVIETPITKTSSTSTLSLATGAAAAGVASFALKILPFFIAYYRGNISREQFGLALKKFVPQITSRTINRIAMLAYFGPLYAAFVLAIFAVKGTLYGFDEKKQNVQKENDEPEPKKEGFFEKKFSRRSLFTLSYLKEF